jgi:hypothetical protein
VTLDLARLTIDMTVVRDYLGDRREGHADATALFALAKAGEVNLAVAPQGHRFDASGQLAEDVSKVVALDGVEEARQLAYLSEHTYPSDTLFVGAFVEGFPEAWQQEVARWPSHEGKPPGVADRFHAETHVLERRDVFITDDRSLLRMCCRLRD